MCVQLYQIYEGVVRVCHLDMARRGSHELGTQNSMAVPKLFCFDKFESFFHYLALHLRPIKQPRLEVILLHAVIVSYSKNLFKLESVLTTLRSRQRLRCTSHASSKMTLISRASSPSHATDSEDTDLAEMLRQTKQKLRSAEEALGCLKKNYKIEEERNRSARASKHSLEHELQVLETALDAKSERIRALEGENRVLQADNE